MKPRDIADLVLLGALWGASFLFMRVAAPEFGPIPLIAVRVAVGALFLLPFLAWRVGLASLRTGLAQVWTMGILNSALPFCLFAFAALSLPSGVSAIVNSSSPLWGALIAWVWLGERLSVVRVTGLVIGFAGVLLLMSTRATFALDGASPGIAAALLASCLYGFAANYARRNLAGIPSLAVATGTQLAAAAALALPALWLWPDHPISQRAWLATLAMGVASSGIAFILYFRLIARVGATIALAVTYLIPLFALLFGAMFLAELPTLLDLAGCAVILVGTAFATGMLAWPPGRREV